MSKTCISCNSEHTRRSDICPKCYYKEYHKKNYINKLAACGICGQLSQLGRKKFCDLCEDKRKNICCDCGRGFFYRAKMKRCTTCQYHWYKTHTPEKFTAFYKERSEKQKAERRIKKGLAVDHVFHKGPKGEGYLNKSGYRRMVYKNPNGKGYIRIYQHVEAMEKHLCRKLLKNESVHHKNGIRDDNRIENLELWHKGQPSGQRVEDKIKWCIDFLSGYGYKLDSP